MRSEAIGSSHESANAWPRVLRLVLFAAPLALLVVAGGSAASDAASGTGKQVHRTYYRATPVKAPIVPVLAESGGATSKQRLRFATVKVYALSAPRKRHGFTRKATLVGSGKTGSRGIALVRLRTKRAPGMLRVAVTGGRTAGGRFHGTMLAQVAYRAPHSVYATPPSTVIARDQLAHPRRKLAASSRRVRATLDIPGFANLASDLASRSVFDGRAFMRHAARRGGFDRYVAELVKRANGRAGDKPVAKTRPAAKSAAVAHAADAADCWSNAAQTTAGFAQYLGFTGVPNPPQVCSLSASSSSVRAHSSQIAVIAGVVSAVAAVGNLAYKVFSGQSSASTLSQMQGQLDTMQTQLTEIQQTLAGLGSAVSTVAADVTNGNISELVAAANPTIQSIKASTDDVNALVGFSYQVVCPTGSGSCTSLSGYGNFGNAMDLICDDATTACNSFYSLLSRTTGALRDAKPVQAVDGLASDALGSAGSDAPASAGIVQYSLQAGAGREGFFQTADAAAARLQWAYYTLASMQAQSTYAIALSMGVGQPVPWATSKHPPTVTAANVVSNTNDFDPTIDAFLGAFPNMPDTAVIVTNSAATGDMAGDPPTMFAQQVGGIADIGIYQANNAYTIDPANVQSGRIAASDGSGAYMTTLQTSGGAPVVMTPAASDGDTWQLLPSSGTRAPPTPAMSVAYFGDWYNAGASLRPGVLPQWDSSSNTVVPSNGGLYGPLADLYGGAPTSNSPTYGTQTPGQWMTSQSGIDDGLLTVQNTGYGNTANNAGFSGVVPYYGKSGSDGNDPGLNITGCTPADDYQCLLPTWLTVSSNPYSQVTSGSTYNTGSSEIITGLYDFNNGVVIDNQQGHDQNAAPGFTTASLPSNKGTWLNQYPSWSSQANQRGVYFPGFVDALNGIQQGSLPNAAYNGNGRPVLFNRNQTANDCFYWSGATGSNPAAGTGCLTPRTKSTQILP
jgi:hypothetical protein